LTLRELTLRGLTRDLMRQLMRGPPPGFGELMRDLMRGGRARRLVRQFPR